MAEEEEDAPLASLEGPRDMAVCASEWLRDLTRAVKVARLYRAQNPVAIETRARLAASLNEHLATFGDWTFRVTSKEILLGTYAVLRPIWRPPGEEAVPLTFHETLPLLFYRDGVRKITLLPGIPVEDVDALIDAINEAWLDRGGIDDLVTTLWHANPTHIVLDTVPFDQMLYLSTGPGGGGESGVEVGAQGLGIGLAPRAEEKRADLEDGDDAPRLQLERPFDEALPTTTVSPADAFDLLQAIAPMARVDLQIAWKIERGTERLGLAAELFARLQNASSDEATRASLARYVVTGVAGSIAHTRWDEACRSLEVVRRLDPEGVATTGALIAAVAAQSETDLGESLDEATPAEQGRFFAFAVGLGEAGVALALAALAGARRSRTRAAACTALSYLCSDNPEQLAGAVCDHRGEVVSGVVSVLGQIGGAAVAPLLKLAAQHPDAGTRKEVARALAAVPAPQRSPLLVAMIEGKDFGLCAEALKVARLEWIPEVVRALMRQIEDPSFERRSDEQRLALYHTLADVGGDRIVPTLEEQLLHGGWLARGSWRRSSAAYALVRIGSDAARAALERGLKHPAEAVRATCRDAIERKAA